MLKIKNPKVKRNLEILKTIIIIMCFVLIGQDMYYIENLEVRNKNQVKIITEMQEDLKNIKEKNSKNSNIKYDGSSFYRTQKTENITY